jgi:hypothetical protein
LRANWIYRTSGTRSPASLGIACAATLK